MIKEFSKANLKDVRNEVTIALAAVNAKLGINLQLGNIRFNANTFTAKLEGAVKTADGVVIDKDLDSLKRNAGWMLTGVDINKNLVDPALGEIKLVGLNTRRGKYPVIVQVVKSGKRYKMGVAQIKRMAGVKVDAFDM